jgi:MFS family permease
VSVGILLSVNRFIRFFSNTLAGYGYSRYGSRLPMVFSAGVGALTTLSYGLVSGFLAFLIARAAWGVGWSFLRQGGFMRVVSVPVAQRGKAMGLFQSISRTGSLIGVLAGGYLLDALGFKPTVTILAFGSVTGILVALSLKEGRTTGKGGVDPKPPSNFSRLLGDPGLSSVGLGTMITSLVRALLASTLALHLLELVGTDRVGFLGFTIGIATAGGLLLGMQWVGRLAAGPLLGFASDRVGRTGMTMVLFALAVVGMGALSRLTSLPLIAGCVVLAFFSLAGLEVVLATSASDLAAHERRAGQYVISSFANWMDLGAALGPLTAYVLKSGVPFQSMYLGGAVALCAPAALLGLAMRNRHRAGRDASSD